MTHLLPPDGVPASAWAKIARQDGTRWAIAERDANGEIIGTAYRDADGGKDFKRGGKRGLILEWPVKPYTGTSIDAPIFVCEGASDTAAVLGLGLDAVGVPMAGHCGPMVAELLADRHAVIVADGDDAGRRGAYKIAEPMTKRYASVRIMEPPKGAKDARAAVIAGADRMAFLDAARAAQPTEIKDTDDGEPIDGEPVIVWLCDVKAQPIEWLWPGRFAVGKLTLIAGDPGLGKSFLTLDMAARVTRGWAWPDSPSIPTTPGSVVLLNAEDAVADTIRPRLEAAGADLSRIATIDAVRTVKANGRELVRAFDLSRDLAALERTVRAAKGCRLVVIDPVTAYLGGTDSHKNADIRGLLAPLGSLAERYGVALVAVTHLNKSNGGPAIYRGMGSLAFVAAARAAWMVAKDTDDDARRLLVPMKNNIAPNTGGLAFRVVPWDQDAELARVDWEPDRVNMTADEALASFTGGYGGGRTERDDATDWLRDYLSAGPKPASSVISDAKAAGFSKRTIDRAKPEAVVRTRKAKFGGGWVWELTPGQGRQSDAEDCQAPDGGNLGTKPDESREILAKIATGGEVATLDEIGGNLGDASAGEPVDVG